MPRRSPKGRYSVPIGQATQLAEARALKQVQFAAGRLVLIQEIERSSYRIQRDARIGIVNAAKAGTVGAVGGVRQFAELLGRNMGDPADLLDAHQTVAAAMRESVSNSFQRQVKTRSGQYRVGDSRITKGGFLFRYSGGALKAAIQSPSLAIGTADSIKFVDEGRLTREAAHWARLNFGAAPHQRPKTTFALRFDGRVVGSVGFNVGSRPGFSMPPGYFVGGDSGKRVPFSYRRAGQDKFMLGAASRQGPERDVFKKVNGRLEFVKTTSTYRTGLDRRKTRGIRPRNFLDAGLATMAVQLPLQYAALQRKWAAKAGEQVKQSSVTIDSKKGLKRSSGPSGVRY